VAAARWRSTWSSRCSSHAIRLAVLRFDIGVVSLSARLITERTAPAPATSVSVSVPGPTMPRVPGDSPIYRVVIPTESPRRPGVLRSPWRKRAADCCARASAVSSVRESRALGRGA
jgi:hypothetical protein